MGQGASYTIFRSKNGFLKFRAKVEKKIYIQISYVRSHTVYCCKSDTKTQPDVGKKDHYVEAGSHANEVFASLHYFLIKRD